MRALRLVTRVIDRLDWAGVAIAGVALLLMAVLTGYETLARYLFRAPVSWAIEIPQYLLTLGTALALAYTQQVRGHISVGFIESRLPPVGKNILTVALYPIYFALVIFLTWAALRMARISLVESRYSTTLHLPLAIPQLFIVIGAIMLCLQVLVDMGRAIGALIHKGGKA